MSDTPITPEPTDADQSVDLGAGEASAGGVGVGLDAQGFPVVVSTNPHQSITGAALDPTDGQPIFGEWEGQPMSRQRYLDASRNQRKDELVAQLKQPVEEEQ